MDEVTRHEEELFVDTEVVDAGGVRARKRVEVDAVAEFLDRRIEEMGDLEVLPAREGDSGEVEVLTDGSVSIPLLEERLVVTKEVVVRERVVIRKKTLVENERVEANVRRERVEIEPLESPDEPDAGA